MINQLKKEGIVMSSIEKWFENLIENGSISQAPANYDTATYKMYVAYLETELELHKRALYRLAKEFVKIKGYEPFEVSQLVKEITIPEFLQKAEHEIKEKRK